MEHYQSISDLVFQLDVAVGDKMCHIREITEEDLPKINQWVGARKLVDVIISKLSLDERREVMRRKYEMLFDEMGDN